MLSDIFTKFWNYRYFDENIRTATNKIHTNVRYIQIIMVMIVIIALFCHLLKPVLLSNAVLPIESYIPKSDSMFAIVVSSQFYCVWLCIAVLTAYDFVYVTCCIHVILQLRLLKHNIKDALDKYEENPKQRLCCYIRHHQFLYS